VSVKFLYAEYQAFGGVAGGVKTIITTDILAANVVTGNEVLANTLTAAHIQVGSLDVGTLNFTPLYSATGVNDVVATINASSEGLNITADRIAIAGTTTFSSGWAAASNAESDIDVLNTTHAPAESGADVTGSNTANDTTYVNGLLGTSVAGWAHGSDTTQIDGGSIYTGTVILSALAFIPVQDTNVIASINASNEDGGTLNIAANKIAISGSCTFSSGWAAASNAESDINVLNTNNAPANAGATDNTVANTKLTATGGAYNSAASGARVRIFPDVNTGIQVIDNVGADVFKVMVGGADVGDVVIGSSTKYMQWDKDADKLIIQVGDAARKVTIGEDSYGYAGIEAWNTAVTTHFAALTITSGTGDVGYSVHPGVTVLGLPTSSISGRMDLNGSGIAIGRYIHTTAAYEGCGVIVPDSTYTAGNYDLRIQANNDLILKVLGSSDVVKVPTGHFDIVTGTLRIGGTEICDSTREMSNLTSVTAIALKYTTGLYDTNTDKVLGTRGAAVADATDPASTMARLNDLLARLRTHGLIDT